MSKAIASLLKPFRKHRYLLLLNTNGTLLALLLFSSCVLINACTSDANKSSSKEVQKRSRLKQNIDTVTLHAPSPGQTQTKNDTAIEVMKDKDIVFNGRLKRYFSLKQFQVVLGEPDSSKLLTDEQPCSNIFQEPDGSVHPKASYLYKNGSRFESSQDKVAKDEVNFSHGDYVIFRKQTLNKHTTLATLRQLFPNAIAHADFIDVAGEGVLQVIQLREDKDNISDGHINIFLKDGKLYKLHWWFPC